MKKLLLLLLVVPAISFGQEPVIIEKKVVCNWTNIVLEGLSKEFKETPIWLGFGEDRTNYSLFTHKSGAWTLVQFNREIACILGSGETSRQIIKSPKL